MDTVLSLLSQLFSSLSPSQFFMVIGAIIIITIFSVKFVISQTKKKDGFFAFMFAESPISDELNERFKKINEGTDEVLQAITTIAGDLKVGTTDIKTQISDFMSLRKDMETIIKTMKTEINDLKHQLQMHEIHEQQTLDTLKDTFQRALDVLAKITAQIGKVDEFVTAAIPEFRGYHQELSRDLSELDKDIALVERSIQNQISNISAVKLR